MATDVGGLMRDRGSAHAGGCAALVYIGCGCVYVCGDPGTSGLGTGNEPRSFSDALHWQRIMERGVSAHVRYEGAGFLLFFFSDPEGLDLRA